MKEKKIVWHFQRFLIENRVYKSFIDNVESKDNPFKGRYGILSVKSLLNKISPREWIGYGFQWSLTKEGDNFWRILYFRWRDTLNNLEKL